MFDIDFIYVAAALTPAQQKNTNILTPQFHSSDIDYKTMTNKHTAYLCPLCTSTGLSHQVDSIEYVQHKAIWGLFFIHSSS